jgi:hypothetical protein
LLRQKPVSAVAKPLGSVLPVQNRLEISFMNLFLKILYVVCGLNGNGKLLSTQFLENDEVAFHLAAMSQCEQGGEGHI